VLGEDVRDFKAALGEGSLAVAGENCLIVDAVVKSSKMTDSYSGGVQTERQGQLMKER
jgi:hypothetical protein